MDKKILKKAFVNVKSDIDKLNNRLDNMENMLNTLISTENVQKTAKNNEIRQSSSGNEGVRSINHSTINHSTINQSPSKQGIEQYTPQMSQNYGNKAKVDQSLSTQSLSNQSLNVQKLNIQSLKKDLELRFNALTSQEFLVFLTIYQLEEDLGRPVTYTDLSDKLKLTPGCIRGYISALIRKNLPISKAKINNRTLTLSIKSDFKELNLKQKLTNIYYDQDPDQTKLF